MPKLKVKVLQLVSKALLDFRGTVIMEETAMASENKLLDRHYELWKDRNKQIRNWMGSLLFFALVLHYRVLIPQLEFSGREIDLSARQAEAQGELAGVNDEISRLNSISTRLDTISQNIKQQPWNAPKEVLKTTLMQLGAEYRHLKSLSVEKIRGEISGSSRMHKQTDPPDDAYRWKLLINKEDLQERINDIENPSFLENHLKKRAQEEADKAIGRIDEEVQATVILPLETLLRTDAKTSDVFTDLDTQLSHIREDMESWKNKHIKDQAWHKTVQAKESKLDALTKDLDAKQKSFIKVVQDRQALLETEKTELVDQQITLVKREDKVTKDLEAIQAKLDKILPAWLKGLVLPEEIIQLYPPVVLVLVLLIGTRSLCLRRNYQVVRRHLYPKAESRRDPDLSSIWTLVYRGKAGTASTTCLYLLSLALLWYLFEGSCDLGTRWISKLSPANLLISQNHLSATQWMGRILFSAGLLGVVTTLFRDWKAGNPKS
jgi:hypothetical protein